MKKTLLVALALVAVGCAEPEPNPRNVDELSRQGPQYLDPETQRTTANEVYRGRECQRQESINQLDCTYTVGEDLEFDIAGVGQRDASITVLRTVGYEGDFYASFGLLHGCVIVKPGSGNPAAQRAFQMAFVSPRTGEVYADWETCADG